MGSSPQAHATFRTPVLACSVILLGTLVLSAAGPASGTAGRQVSVPEVVPVSPTSLVNVIDQLIGSLSAEDSWPTIRGQPSSGAKWQPGSPITLLPPSTFTTSRTTSQSKSG